MASLPLPRWNLAITLPASGPRLWRREWWSTLTLTGIAAKDWDSIAKKEKLDVPVEEASFVHSEPPQDGSAPPVVSSDMEVLHDKVKKQVIKEGHGRKPIKFATCFACIGGGIQPCRRVARIARRAMHTWTVAGIASWGVPTLADIALDGRRELSLKLFFIY
ncbi:hypothetical protein BDA96_07G095800 [Sorghum bicolor]|uniref:Uncharacterized protein n=2 Tax=Sorghum bicolor TaxID=4558 RepID=A0A921U9B2_SORBI|nr:uncharacterized protein LOC110437043 isoform X2 [Sorghum bicolor]XP_021320808.1 uncharacterized protein LOC110437043 isoform X2 [Sorghum bicolor]KAG0523108.1 hypothetical protein BDA96_07G095800 [Sorghum bicolor]OQU80175.1 hypothetical protein SORBI_3007G090448 [Sorghum bicolor]|eukprot:XP_021320807.1 uncharacterized protein LOC110437043 isoform X2 [Sorghum bicolor]